MDVCNVTQGSESACRLYKPVPSYLCMGLFSLFFIFGFARPQRATTSTSPPTPLRRGNSSWRDEPDYKLDGWIAYDLGSAADGRDVIRLSLFALIRVQLLPEQ